MQQDELGAALARGLARARAHGHTAPLRVIEYVVEELPFARSGQRKVLNAARDELGMRAVSLHGVESDPWTHPSDPRGRRPGGYGPAGPPLGYSRDE